MMIVVALCGNVLLGRREPMTAENQRANIQRAAAALAALVAAGHSGRDHPRQRAAGGLLALQADASPDPPFPLDAESAGMIGYVSRHPVSVAIEATFSGRARRTVAYENVVEYPGLGIEATLDGRRCRLGRMP